MYTIALYCTGLVWQLEIRRPFNPAAPAVASSCCVGAPRRTFQHTQPALTASARFVCVSLLHSYGPNALTPPKKPGFWAKLWAQLNNVLIFILLAAAVVVAGLQEWIEFGLILGVVSVNVMIGMVQEGKAEKAAEAIKAMLSSSGGYCGNCSDARCMDDGCCHSCRSGGCWRSLLSCWHHVAGSLRPVQLHFTATRHCTTPAATSTTCHGTPTAQAADTERTLVAPMPTPPVFCCLVVPQPTCSVMGSASRWMQISSSLAMSCQSSLGIGSRQTCGCCRSPTCR